jgi:hypothetical protein
MELVINLVTLALSVFVLRWTGPVAMPCFSP